MCEAAPGIIDLLDRMGVPFNRTPEGLLDFRRFGGTLYNRTAFAGATTGQQLLYALDEQVRRLRVRRQGSKYESWEFLSAVLDGKRVAAASAPWICARWRCAPSPPTPSSSRPAACGAIFGKSTNSVVCTGSAQSALYQQGCYYANGEFIQVHPTSIPGEDKLRLMSESARGEGGRVWVPKTGRRQARSPVHPGRVSAGTFLEEWYPKYGNLVPRDVATRAIFKVVLRAQPRHRRQADGLSRSHPHRRKTLDRKLEGILEIYEKFVGDDPRDTPMKIFPGMHYTMGGLWVDYNQATNIPGIFAAGECEYQYHGANRLGANSLVSCIYGGFVAGPNAVRYAKNLQAAPGNGHFAAEQKRQEEINNRLMRSDGSENPFLLWRELGALMTENCTVIRYNKTCQEGRRQTGGPARIASKRST
jgi:succinate dehydrogenase / fumarate reductase flavoprotein subunit